jgi:hypothetical protein
LSGFRAVLAPKLTPEKENSESFPLQFVPREDDVENHVVEERRGRGDVWCCGWLDLHTIGSEVGQALL